MKNVGLYILRWGLYHIGLGAVMIWAQLLTANAQDTQVNKSVVCKFPITIGLQFQNFALPFKDFGSNFSHPGISIGSEINLNKRKNLIQQINVGGYLNKEMGNGFLVYSQTAYRPKVFKHLHPGLSIGIGWIHTYHPVDAYAFEDGTWSKTVDGKSQLIIPVGVGIEYNKPTLKPYIVPYLTYQIVPDLFYNDVVQLSFYTIIQLGVKINLKHK